MNPDVNEEEEVTESVRRLLGGPAEGMVLDEPVSRIAARGRSQRRHRRALSAAVGGAGVAGVVALALVLPTAAAGVPAGAPRALKVTSLNVDVAAFSVKTDPSSPYIVITVKQLGDEDLLKQYLKRLGIDADVHELSLASDQSLLCSSTAGPSAMPFGGFVYSATFDVPKAVMSGDPHLQIFVGRKPDGKTSVVLAHTGLTCAAAIIPDAVVSPNGRRIAIGIKVKVSGS